MRSILIPISVRRSPGTEGWCGDLGGCGEKSRAAAIQSSLRDGSGVERLPLHKERAALFTSKGLKCLQADLASSIVSALRQSPPRAPPATPAVAQPRKVKSDNASGAGAQRRRGSSPQQPGTEDWLLDTIAQRSSKIWDELVSSQIKSDNASGVAAQRRRGKAPE